MTNQNNNHQKAPKGLKETLRYLWRSDRGDTPIQLLIGAVIAVVLIVPTIGFFTSFLTTTSLSAVDAERSKDLRSQAIDEFEAKPWNQVLDVFNSNQIKELPVDPKFKLNFNIKYAVDDVDNTGGYVVKLIAPRANVNQSACNDPRSDKGNVCLYYQYTKTPTLSEGLIPSWNGMNYGQGDLAPANGTTSPSLAITNNRMVNIGSYDGCSALTPDRIRVTFKWVSTNGLRPGSVQHLVIADKLYETIPLSSASPGDTTWYAATINKPQPSTCFNAEKVRVVIDNGATGTLSDLYVSQLLSKNNNQHDGSTDTPDAALPHIVANPAWATDGTKWYFTFDNPLTGSEVQSYQIRGTGSQAACNTTTQTISKNNANNGSASILAITGTFASVSDLKTKVCDRYYIISVGSNGYNSAEISFLSAGINRVINVDNAGQQVAPPSSTNGHFAKQATNWYLKFDQANVSAIDHFIVQGFGTNTQCKTNEQSVVSSDGKNMLSLGSFASEATMRSTTCDSYKVIAIGTNGIPSAPVTFTSSAMTNIETL